MQPQHAGDRFRVNTVRLNLHRDYLGRYIGATQQLCPVCLQPASATPRYQNIESHLDSIGLDQCPASGEPYRITVSTPTERMTA